VEAAFTRVGPGQSLRLVYQVMGQNGPIANPTNIRYIPADSAEVARFVGNGLPPLSALTAYAQLANVGLGLANVGLSAAVLVEARKQTKMLRELQADVKQIRADLDVLVETTHRIDVNVAQGHLREGLKHAFRSASNGGEVDLVLLARLTDEALHLFYPSVGGPISIGSGRGLVLASDVRELAESAMHLLFAARRTALEAHNLGCGGDPASVVRDDLIPSTFTRVAETAALLVTNKHRAAELADEVRHHLRESWKFYGDTGRYRRLVRRNLAGRLEKDLGLLREVPVAKAVLEELGKEKTFEDASSTGPAAVAATVAAYCDAWVARSDAGLLWRLQQEVHLQQDEQYWSGLDPWSEGITEGATPTGGHTILRDVTLTL
jgi:hypothetical protein